MEGESEGGREGEVVREFWGARLKSGALEWEGGGDGEVVGGLRVSVLGERRRCPSS